MSTELQKLQKTLVDVFAAFSQVIPTLELVFQRYPLVSFRKDGFKGVALAVIKVGDYGTSLEIGQHVESGDFRVNIVPWEDARDRLYSHVFLVRKEDVRDPGAWTLDLKTMDDTSKGHDFIKRHQAQLDIDNSLVRFGLIGELCHHALAVMLSYALPEVLHQLAAQTAADQAPPPVLHAGKDTADAQAFPVGRHGERMIFQLPISSIRERTPAGN